MIHFDDLKKNILVLTLCFAAGFSNAQTVIKKTGENKYRVAHWTIYDGLSQAEPYYMLKDVNGFLWIATKIGLNRFDGSLFKTYYHDPKNKHTIAGDHIGGLIEDSLHNIWIGSDRGLSRYDIKADTFSNFIPSKNDPDNSVSPFWATKDELYALESGFRIVVYNTHSFAKRELVNLAAADSIGLGPSVGYAIFDQGSNSVWMLRGAGLPGDGLLNVSLSDGKKQYYSWPCFLKIPGHGHACEAMRYDRKRNAIWINSPDGLMEFTLADKQFHHIDALNELLKLKDYHRFVGVDLDLQGRVWVATDPKGILIYDPSDKSLSIPFPADSVVQHDVSDANVVIYCDRDGIIWLGTWLRKGFYQLIPYSPAVKLYMPDPKRPIGFFDNAVVSITKVRGGKLWLGTLDGLFEFNRQSGMVKALNKKDFPGLKANNMIIPAFIDLDLNMAWVVTDAGNFEMDMKTQICRQVIFKDRLGKSFSIEVPGFFFPFKNRWVIVDAYKDKQFIFTGKDDNITASEAVSIPNNSIDITTDYDHLLFIKQDEKAGNLTFSYLDGKLLRVHHKMDTLQWTSIFFNKKDRTYWVAASKQIIHYNNNFKIIRAYGQENGLPDIAIVALIADNDGNIWFHTDRTIHQLNVATGEVSTLTGKDGFVKQDFFLLNNNYKDDNGDIYFPGGVFGSGFNRITPGKYTNPPSSIYLQSLEINQKPFTLPTGVNNLKQLSLSYNENKITIETGIIDYYSKGTSHMRYKLGGKGINENWQFGPANYTIRFEGLQPGKYKLRMQASNAALQFNGPEKVLMIIISPPWWQTWWAWLIFLFCFISMMWAIVHYRSRSLIRAKSLLEQKVQLRTAEVLEQKEEIATQRDSLEQTLEELKTTQTQLVQREKMASLGELTAGIAHEIQNPLNFVNNFSEVSIELLDELKEEARAGHNADVITIAGDLTQNLEKISHHGKRADNIVKGMLQHSRAGSGKKEPANINALADEYLRLAYHGLRASDKSFNAEMITHFDPKLPAVNVIPQDIGRVLLNLFNNAFYAVHQRQKTAGADYKPEVSVTTSTENGQVIIKVKDNGVGIPDAIKEKIMQPFFTTKPTGEGTGLGLSLTYDMVVKGHGGGIQVNSVEREGSEFVVSLPL